MARTEPGTLAPTGCLVSVAEAQAIADASAESLSASTRRSYASACRVWERWCAERGAIPYPADPALLAAHLTWLAGRGRSVSTLDRAVAALRVRHLDAGMGDPTVQRGVRKVRAGLRRRVGAAPTRQAHPLSTAEVRRLVATCQAGRLRDVRDRALILLGFAAALRPSEIGALRASDITVRSRGIVLRIRRSKGDQEGAGQVVGVVRGEHTDTDPVAAVLAWKAAAGLSRTDPLFPPVSWSGLRPGTRPLGPKGITRILQDRAAQAGLGDLPVSGHSLRAGHATVAAEAGVPAERIARTTRHVNLRTLATYVRPAQVLADTSSSALGL